MKETDRSALARIFERYDPLWSGYHKMAIRLDAAPGPLRPVVEFYFDYDGNLTDTKVRMEPSFVEHE